ncbi:hypothetical protein KP77_01130 [Jeotgalibacillus alimentarius]|uniref:Uncharacterized protein n=1 Tax=Jeotgalibacillus alimentarius TaxID=135826 RepID=A0A0C2WC61_9BACL|nr:hypothetical protein [Jeotgalibacillus alimentarius]KIL53618.1 hypothetical protein KP77_01130 [Jeotgalibacillus alimentarius]
MKTIHLWLSVYDQQHKKPQRTMQPLLPAVILAYRQSMKQPAVQAEQAYQILTGLLKEDHYQQIVKEWEKQNYYSIEERRFGTMVSRLFHLEKKALQAQQDLRELKNRIELHMLVEDDLHYLSFSSLINTRHRAFRMDQPWVIAAEQWIQQRQSL